LSLSTDRSTVARIQKDITALQRKQADEMKKVATASRNMNSAIASANKASSPSSAKSYLGIAERESKNVDAAQEKAARASSDIAGKMSDLGNAQQRVLKGEEDERRKTSDLSEKQRKSDEGARKRLIDDNRALSKDINDLRTLLNAAIVTQASSTQPFVVENPDGRDTPYDFFISHASKDKEDFVDGLVAAARDAGLDVWYDQTAITWGDSIRQKIDEGLRRSFFGVVVLSPNFFERPWTKYELDGIVQRDLTGAGRLLPIWHRLTQDDVAAKAPSLAGRLALPTSTYSTGQIVDELLMMRERFKAVAS
jgi:hypothetical protein